MFAELEALDLPPDTVVALGDIRDALSRARNQVMPFVGSGLSLAGGLPTWRAFLERLIGRLRPDEQNEMRLALAAGRLIEIASFLEPRVGVGVVQQEIRRCFQAPPGPRPAAYDALARLPVDQHLTTNFDPWLEDAVTLRVGRHVRVYVPTDPDAFSDTLPGSPPFVLKLHGDAARPSTCALSLREYRDLSKGVPAWGHSLAAFIHQRNLLFVGYSLSDPDLAELLDTWQAVFAPKGAPPRHWLLDARFSALDRERLRTLGVEPVAYGTHRKLPHILDWLAGGRPPGPPPGQRRPRVLVAGPWFGVPTETRAALTGLSRSEILARLAADPTVAQAQLAAILRHDAVVDASPWHAFRRWVSVGFRPPAPGEVDGGADTLVLFADSDPSRCLGQLGALCDSGVAVAGFELPPNLPGPMVAWAAGPLRDATLADYRRALRVVAGQVILPDEADPWPLLEPFVDLRLDPATSLPATDGATAGHPADPRRADAAGLLVIEASSEGRPSGRIALRGGPRIGKSTLLRWIATGQGQGPDTRVWVPTSPDPTTLEGVIEAAVRAVHLPPGGALEEALRQQLQDGSAALLIDAPGGAWAGELAARPVVVVGQPPDPRWRSVTVRGLAPGAPERFLARWHPDQPWHGQLLDQLRRMPRGDEWTRSPELLALANAVATRRRRLVRTPLALHRDALELARAVRHDAPLHPFLAEFLLADRAALAAGLPDGGLHARAMACALRGEAGLAGVVLRGEDDLRVLLLALAYGPDDGARWLRANAARVGLALLKVVDAPDGSWDPARAELFELFEAAASAWPGAGLDRGLARPEGGSSNGEIPGWIAMLRAMDGRGDEPRGRSATPALARARVRLGRDSVELVQQSLGNPPGARAAAVQGLRVPDDTGLLTELALDQEPEVARAALAALAGDPTARPWLNERLSLSPLRAGTDPAAAPLLREFARVRAAGPATPRRIAAIRALGGDLASRGVLLRCLTDESVAVRVAAVEALAEDPDAPAQLREVLARPGLGGAPRAAAIRALGAAALDLSGRLAEGGVVALAAAEVLVESAGMEQVVVEGLGRRSAPVAAAIAARPAHAGRLARSVSAEAPLVALLDEPVFAPAAALLLLARSTSPDPVIRALGTVLREAPAAARPVVLTAVQGHPHGAAAVRALLRAPSDVVRAAAVGVVAGAAEDALADPSPLVRAAAVQALGPARARAFLRATDSGVRRAAVEVLADSNDASWLPDALRAPDHHLRTAAAGAALAEGVSPAQLFGLCWGYAPSADTDEPGPDAAILAALATPAQLEDARDLLLNLADRAPGNLDVEVATAARRALALDPVGLHALLSRLKEAAADGVRGGRAAPLRAAIAAGLAGRPEARRALRRLLDDPAPLVRAEAVLALAGEPGLEDHVRRALADAAGELRARGRASADPVPPAPEPDAAAAGDRITDGPSGAGRLRRLQHLAVALGANDALAAWLDASVPADASRSAAVAVFTEVGAPEDLRAKARVILSDALEEEDADARAEVGAALAATSPPAAAPSGTSLSPRGSLRESVSGTPLAPLFGLPADPSLVERADRLRAWLASPRSICEDSGLLFDDVLAWLRARLGMAHPAAGLPPKLFGLLPRPDVVHVGMDRERLPEERAFFPLHNLMEAFYFAGFLRDVRERALWLLCTPAPCGEPPALAPGEAGVRGAWLGFRLVGPASPPPTGTGVWADLAQLMMRHPVARWTSLDAAGREGVVALLHSLAVHPDLELWAIVPLLARLADQLPSDLRLALGRRLPDSSVEAATLLEAARAGTIAASSADTRPALSGSSPVRRAELLERLAAVPDLAILTELRPLLDDGAPDAEVRAFLDHAETFWRSNRSRPAGRSMLGLLSGLSDRRGAALRRATDQLVVMVRRYLD